MKNIVYVAAIFLSLTACACHRHGASDTQLRQALKDTNADLTEARGQNTALRAQVKRMATSWHNCKGGRGCEPVR